VKYQVTIGGKTFAVDIDGERVTVDGREVHAQLEAVPHTPMRRFEADGHTDVLSLTREGDAWRIQAGGRGWEATVLDERTRHIRELSGAGTGTGGGGVVRAPMPGMILRVEVGEGESVARGRGLVVLEAMKMENEIRAPEAGVVTRIHAVPGTAVEKGAPLVEVGPSS
jgi:pyruvate carboxylase subunit B